MLKDVFVMPLFPIEHLNLNSPKISVSLFLTNISILLLYMNLRKIIIYKNDVLFQILNEIKEVFHFDIISLNQIDHKEFKKKFKTDFLIISNLEINRLKNQLVIDKTPLKIEKLLEQINLKFLKEKFNFQSDISIGLYRLNINSREISKDNKTLNLTEREINLILFLKKVQSAVKIDELQKKVWEYGSELDTHTVETHIYRLRKKIKEKFNDENFITSSKKGYLLN